MGGKVEKVPHQQCLDLQPSQHKELRYDLQKMQLLIDHDL